MPIFALYDLSDPSFTASDSASENGAQDGIYRNGAASSGGRVVLDGVDDLVKIYTDPAFQLDRGTLQIRFAQAPGTTLDGPRTILSRDSVGETPGGFRVQTLADGAVRVSHESGTGTTVFQTASGFQGAGDSIGLSYSWDATGTSGFLRIVNQTSGARFTETVPAGLTMDMGGQNQNWIIGAGQSASAAGSLQNIDQHYAGAVEVFSVSDTVDNLPLSASRDGIVRGMAGADLIDSTYVDPFDGDVVDGNDAILPGDGPNDDRIIAGGGNDTIRAGLGNDSVSAGPGDDLVFGEAGDDTIFGDGGRDELFGGDGDDLVDAGADDDTISGGAGNDTLLGSDGNDRIHGGTGDDLISGGGDNDLAYGDSGADTIFGDHGNDTLYGGDDDDRLFGGTGNDLLDGGRGNDLLDGGDGDDVLLGADGADTLLGGAGADTLEGGAGGDLLDGGLGNDLLVGDAGDDTLIGGAGDDTLFGGSGNDLFDLSDPLLGGPDAGADRAFGGADRDTFTGVGAGDWVFGGSDGDDFDTLDLTGSGRTNVVRTNVDSDGNGFDGYVEYLDENGTVVGRSDFTNIESIVCFTPGTLIATPKGEVAVENLRVGDKVITRDNGIQEIRWMGARTMGWHEFAANPHLRPVLVKAGSLGHGLPERDMMLSPNHRVLVANDRTALYFDEHEVLVAAKHLIGGQGVRQVECAGTTYIHFMFDRHEVVLSNGAWTESFQPGDYALKGLGNAQRSELMELFPELKAPAGLETYQAARKTLKKHEARLLAR